jgi:hypothetical protein
MATDSPSRDSRRHFHRGRRGQERRGGERRGPQAPPAGQPGEREPAGRGAANVDVEQIMREIRARIAQRHGIELTDQQVQELAARRLESILDPRTIKPALLDQLRKAAGARPEMQGAAEKTEAPFEFEDNTLYDTPNGFLRFLRKLFNPILKLFFNPNPLIRALHIQSGVNAEALRREADRDRRQAEWNALHYELLQRVVSEIAKVSLEVQSVSLRIESLAAKVDFNERRVRQIEGTTFQAKPSSSRERDRDRDRDRERDRDRDRDRDREREREPVVPPPSPTALVAAPVEAHGVPTEAAAPETTPSGEGPRRRRRRRRGRRSGMAGEAGTAALPGAPASPETTDLDEGDEDTEEVAEPIVEAVTTEGEAVAPLEEALAPEPASPLAERVTPQLETIDPAARETAAPDVAPAEPEARDAEPAFPETDIKPR